MPHSIDEKKKAITRLRRIRGQTESLEKAIEEGTDCSILLQQISALRGATNSLMAEVLEGHLRETFGTKNSEVDDVLSLVRTYLK
jgi:DNA-binding FrmR family transcriptional regulator